MKGRGSVLTWGGSTGEGSPERAGGASTGSTLIFGD